MQRAHKMNTPLNIYCVLFKLENFQITISKSRREQRKEKCQESKTSLNVCCYICLTLESSVCFIYAKTLIQ